MLDGVPVETVAVVVVAFLAGATAPTYYAQERLHRFGRFIASRLPYEPPPGVEPGAALEAATEQAAEQATDDEEDDGET